MVNLPTGTVTFLFTDIEGSTLLWERDPEAMAAALAHHDTVVRRAIETYGGYIFKTMGDAFCAAFGSASAALHAAVEAQLALNAGSAPPTQTASDAGVYQTLSLRVRMAIHTGTAAVRDGDYFGPTVNRVARLLAVAHGGQVLLFEPVRALIAAEPPPDQVGLKDLGIHRLKDLAQSERIYQMTHPMLRQEFPPLNSLSAQPNNLPQPLTSFVGRKKEIEEVQHALSSSRLLTLIGAGGTGKTRLSLQVAAELLIDGVYPDGVWLVELAALSDPALVPQTLASIMGVREEPGRNLLQTLADALKPKQMLLILDNCEHLIVACTQLAASLLRACPRLRILASSREPLGITGEHAYRVPSLSLPPAIYETEPGSKDKRLKDRSVDNSQDNRRDSLWTDAEQLLNFEAVRLFVERATLAQPGFNLTADNPSCLRQIVRICRCLDGIPLAIELAAARVKALTIDQIAARLDDRFRLLTGGNRDGLPRQQTLRALIDWSYDLLQDDEKTLLRQLSVFAGGWTLEAAEAVCAFSFASSADKMTFGKTASDKTIFDKTDFDKIEVNKTKVHRATVDVLDLLTHLVDKSLVVYEGQMEQARYRLLETVRQYGQEKLQECGEAETARRQHHRYFLQFAEQAESKLFGAEQATWLDRLEAEHDNLRVALYWGASAESQDSAQLRLAVSLARFWDIRGYLREGSEWLADALDRTQADPRTELRAKALTRLGNLFWRQSDLDRARAIFEESLAIALEMNDRSGIAWAQMYLGLLAHDRRDYTPAITLYEESLRLFRELNDRRGMAANLTNLGRVALAHDDYAQARSLFEESLSIARQQGNQRGMAIPLVNLGVMAYRQRNYLEARAFCEQSLTLYRAAGDKQGIALSLQQLGVISYEEHQFGETRTQLERSLQLFRELGQKSSVVEVLLILSCCVEKQGDQGSARTYREEGLTLTRALNDLKGTLLAVELLARSAYKEGEQERAIRLFAFVGRYPERHNALLHDDPAAYESALAAARADQGASNFERLWTEGANLTLEEAALLAVNSRSRQS